MSNNSSKETIIQGIKSIKAEDAIKWTSIGVLAFAGVIFIYMGVTFIQRARDEPEKTPTRMMVAGSLAIVFAILDFCVVGLIFMMTLKKK